MQNDSIKMIYAHHAGSKLFLNEAFGLSIHCLILKDVSNTLKQKMRRGGLGLEKKAWASERDDPCPISQV